MRVVCGTVGFHDFSPIQGKYGFRHSQLLSVKTADAEELVRAARPDYILAIGLSELLPNRMLDIPMQINAGRSRHEASHGCIGMHPTLLRRFPISASVHHSGSESWSLVGRCALRMRFSTAKYSLCSSNSDSFLRPDRVSRFLQPRFWAASLTVVGKIGKNVLRVFQTLPLLRLSSAVSNPSKKS
jgi:hypothetical protein